MAQPQPMFLDVDRETLTKHLNQAAAAADTAWNRQTSAAGISPATNNGDIVVAAYTVPANAWGVDAQQIQNLYISAAGKFAANGNNKRIKIIVGATTQTVGQAVVGGTVIGDTGTVTTNSGGWSLQAQLVRTGTNAQLGLQDSAVAGTTHLGTAAPVATALTDGAAVNVCVTINNTTTNTDASLQYFEVDGMQ